MNLRVRISDPHADPIARLVEHECGLTFRLFYVRGFVQSWPQRLTAALCPLSAAGKAAVSADTSAHRGNINAEDGYGAREAT
jgi:hypothetical protein